MLRKFLRLSILSLIFINCAYAEPILTDLEGQKIPFSTLKGKWVLINYWASWCPSCLNEIAALNQFYEKNKENVALYAVNYDEIPIEDQKELVKQLGIHYPSLATDPSDSLHLGELRGVPVTFVFNPEGKLTKALYGEQSLSHLNKNTHQGCKSLRC